MAEPDDDDDAPASWKRFVKPVVTVVIVAALAFGLRKLLTSFSYEDVAAGFDRMPKSRIALAALCVAVIHAMYVVRERIGVNFAGHPELSTGKVSVASLISRSLSTLGVATVTGFALRVRLYKEYGLDTAAVGRITVYNESTFYVGTVASIALVFTIGGLPAAAGASLSLPPLGWIGPLAIALIAAYVVWNLRRTKAMHIRSFELPTVTPLQLAAQIVLPLLDTLASGLITYILLPETGLGFFQVVAIGVTASLAGSLSQVPGGLGVYETTMLAFVPTASHPQALAALLVRRAVVNLLPIAVGAVLLVGVSITGTLSKKPSRVALEYGRDAVSILTFTASVLALIAAALPRHGGLTEDAGVLAQATVFAAGIVLLVTARGLQQGRRKAWRWAVTLFAVRALFAVLAGPHWPSLILSVAMLAVLLVGVHLFPHPGPLFDGERSWWTAWLVTLIGVAWVAGAHNASLSTEVRARIAGMIVVVALVLGAAARRALPDHRRRKKRRREKAKAAAAAAAAAAASST